MAGNPLFEILLASQGHALFEHVGEGSFRPIGAYPDWCRRIWGEAAPADAVDANSLRLADVAPFLENFLVDAVAYWDSHTEGSLQSGNWIEHTSEGAEIPLEASAVSLDGKSLLIVRNLSHTFAEQQELYQTARDSLLEHERLVREIQKKEILLHCIIHDLTQPLTAMTGCFDLLSAEKLPDRITNFVKIGHRESQRQEQMIRGILEAFSADLSAQQAQGGKADEPPDIAACAAQEVQDLSAAFSARGVRLKLDAQIGASRDWKVKGDAPRIQRIFGNLLENAMRYTPRGKGVTVGVEDEGDSVLAFVDDEGPGLPPDDANGASTGKLFALLAKGKDRPGKAGLGLYFCKVTVERWGGTIGAENRAQGGSRFWFRLPRAAGKSSPESAEEKTVAAAHPREDAVVERTTPGTGNSPDERAALPMRILIAEDNEANRELMTELLKGRGHSVSDVGDGREALAALKRQSFDVLLMDEEMPRMSGIEATRAIRSAEVSSGKHLVIIGITGNVSGDDEKRLLDAGMDAFLPKPVRMETLYQAVESHGHAVEKTAAEEAAPPPSGAPALPENEDAATHLRRTTGGNETLMRSLAKTFLADAPGKFSALRRAIAGKDADALAKTAHALKGALGIFGAPQAVALARSLEAMGRTGSVGGAAELFASLEAEFTSLDHQLQALQQKSKPKPKSKSKSKPAPKRSSRPRRKR
jgi:signal transduction histidine kinase/HPt (histidine-containing phosphotransfer) domain-containing protein/AmiR/NasT family two-component response regulator